MRRLNLDLGRFDHGVITAEAVVIFVCTAESHASRVAKINLFVRRRHSRWQLEPAASVSHPDDLWWKAHGRIELIDDSPLDTHLLQGDPRVRSRYQLHCSLCNLSVPVRAEKLDPVLDKLAEHAAAWELDLTDIARILS